jgi:ABC-type nitrate/sulfonate/bicarbonate transport system permease component
MSKRVKNILLQLWLPVLIVLVWWFGSAAASSAFFPPLSDIVEGFRANWLFERVPTEFLPSVWRFLAGFALGSVIAVIVGTILGQVPWLYRSLRPTVDFLRSIPVTTLVSAFIILFGFGNFMNIAYIAWAAFFPVLLNTVDGVLGIEPTQKDLARTYQVSWWDRQVRMILPAASPQIFVGLRISLAVALLVMVYGEMVSTTDGLGFFILFAQSTFRVVDMWSGIILLGLLGLFVNLIFVAIETRVLAWHRGWRASVLEGS